MLFKGFSVLTTLGYEVAVPQRDEEMVLSIVAQSVKVVIDAYILGTLFHYLVKKDPELEATRGILAGLHQYCSDRSLSRELTSKMESYLLFQQKHSSAVSISVMRVRCSQLVKAACRIVKVAISRVELGTWLVCRASPDRCKPV